MNEQTKGKRKTEIMLCLLQCCSLGPNRRRAAGQMEGREEEGACPASADPPPPPARAPLRTPLQTTLWVAGDGRWVRRQCSSSRARGTPRVLPRQCGRQVLVAEKIDSGEKPFVWSRGRRCRQAAMASRGRTGATPAPMWVLGGHHVWVGLLKVSH